MIEDKELLDYLLREHKIGYRNVLTLNPEVTFGAEIECIPNDRVKSREAIRSKFDKKIEHKIEDTVIYDEWIYERDGSLKTHDGFEINSPILTNTEENWLEFKRKLDEISTYMHADELCGAHIHFGQKHLIGNDPNKLLNLLKLWAVYEDVIYRFSYGEYINPRMFILDYAKPIAKEIKDTCKKLKGNDFLYEGLLRKFVIEASINDLSKRGLNIENLLYEPTKPTIEVRTPNGTVNPVIWQNNINFFGKLFEYATSDRFEVKEVSDELRDLQFPQSSRSYKKYSLIESYDRINFAKACKLADLIFDNELDKLNFLKQYIKAGETNTETLRPARNKKEAKEKKLILTPTFTK